jgi:hypothetical protein
MWLSDRSLRTPSAFSIAALMERAIGIKAATEILV